MKKSIIITATISTILVLSVLVASCAASTVTVTTSNVYTQTVPTTLTLAAQTTTLVQPAQTITITTTKTVTSFTPSDESTVTTNPSGEVSMSFKIKKFDYQLLEDGGYSDFICSYIIPIYIGEGQILHMNWIADENIENLYRLPNDSKNIVICQEVDDGSIGYTIIDTTGVYYDYAELTTNSNINFKMGDPYPTHPGWFRGNYQPGYYTFCFYSYVPEFVYNQITQKYPDLFASGVPSKPTADDFNTVIDQSGWAGINVNVQYYIENQ